ncbi:MAG TPA: hypothetical protein VGP10_04475 [Marisediminicola sp.]|nr:hypothetical protein [Marisediminicola sp.]
MLIPDLPGCCARAVQYAGWLHPAAIYLGLRPLLMLAVPALIGMSTLGTLLWLVRTLSGQRA